LFVNETIGLLQVFSYFVILFEFVRHLHLDKLSDQLGVGFEQFYLRKITVLKVVGGKIDSRSFCHYVDYYLNDSLLLKSVTSMLVALEVAKH
jgi:hypothetical protein